MFKFNMTSASDTCRWGQFFIDFLTFVDKALLEAQEWN